MSTMESLLRFQYELKERLSKALSNYKKSPKDRLYKEYIEGRIDQVEQLWLEFMTGHKTLMCSHNSKELRSSQYVTEETYDKAEEVYLESKSIMRSHLAKISSENQPSPSQTTISPHAQIKLPKIDIPKFSGDYSEWSTFRDLFTSLVHNNTSIGDVEKLHYLKAYLTGEAEQLLRNIPIVNSKYEFCWKLLQERYNNKRYICHQNLSKLLNQKLISVESAKLLKNLMDTTKDCLNALLNIGIDVKGWDVLLIYILVLKLDPETRRQWEFSINTESSEELPTFNKFCEFLTNRYRAIEFLESTSKHNPRQNTSITKIKSLHTNKHTCLFCSEEHRLVFCKAFGREAVEVRRQFVLDNNLCYNCLGGGHSARECRNTARCQVCKRSHHSLLHPMGKVVPEAKVGRNEDRGSSGSVDISPKSTAEESKGTTSVVSCFSSRKINYSQVLLATAVVEAMSRTGKRYRVRALLDQGSQSSFITESTVQYLGLKKSAVQSHISGLGGDNNVISKATVMIEIKSCVDPNVTITVQAYVLKCITSLMPTRRLEDIQWTELDNIPLADPEYHTPNRIDILLGAEVYGEIIQDGVKKGPCGTLAAQATSLGWIVSGVVKTTINPPSNIRAMHCHISNADNDINSLLKRFWEIESDTQVPKEKLFTNEEKMCEQYFAETTQRDEEGRYIVCLPLKPDPPQVTGSRDIAERRLKSLENKLMKNDTLRQSYQGVIDDYVKSNHMELVPPEEIDDEKAVYLPHHAVIREDKETTKIRVVYDASCKGRNGLSLNDHLMVGPTLQPELRHTLMRWRLSPICLTADITKMYCQVKIQKDNVDYQRILWRAGPETQHYRLLRVTFGTASAPYLAVKALQQVAVDEGESFPLVCNKVKTDFYVDDLLTGCQTKEEGKEIYKQMNGLLAKGGFELMKWSSNDDDLLEEMKGLGKDDDVKDGLKIKENDVMKIMGLTWNRNDDTFRYAVTLPELQQPVTKRRIIISDISRFYDPLGWARPSIIIAKIIIQRLWLAGIGWDEVVPKEILKEWLTYREELKMLSQIHIPRWAGTKKGDKLVELHGFCDASKEAYAAVVYIRVLDSAGGIHVTLVSSKTKVAPVKQVSIARLELCGAVLLCRLMVEIAQIMDIKREHLHAWTDSTVVLAWLNSHPSRWNVFVANRVSEILTSLDPQNWSHVKSKQNPADCASRGLHPAALAKETMWFCGPEFLKLAEITYEKPKNISSNLEEIKSHCATVPESILERFSSLTRMTRVISWCRRFANNARKPDGRVTDYLTSKELSDTLTLCIRNAQLEGFCEDIDFIKTRKDLPKRSKLRALNPYLDDNQVLRVGGRLDNSSLAASQRHPILMPKLSYLTHLIISDAHQRTLHGGPQLMLNFIQSKYWILGVKPLVKRAFRKCAICVKHTAATKTPLMGQVPAARVTPARAFSCSGVDFAGPIQIRTAKGRGYKSHKGYICVFVCMATRAIHLEVVSDLTSEGFLQAFKRFVARRGRCSDMWSDNGTNFIGAAGELTKLAKAEQHSMLKEVAEAVATNGCEWHFIPPHAPNFGGLWEAGVKSVKYHLKRVLGGSTLTYEEMATVLAQIEACLNSRPLSVQIDDPNHPSVLTPGHFLVGEPLITAPDKNYESGNESSLRRWQHTQRMLQSFWRQWSQEYLTKFLQRHKWSRQVHQPTIGDVVIIKEDGLPPCRWLFGRIIAIHQGSDKIARVVTLKTKNGTLKRPVSKLCFLPVTE